MRYLFILLTILAIWITLIILAFVIKDVDLLFGLYLRIIIFTVILSLLGFRK